MSAIRKGIVYVDFEFNKVVEPKVNLVSCATYYAKTKDVKKFWLHNSPKQQSNLKKYFSQFKTVVGYACVAEARSFIALGLDPLAFEWIDLFLEYRMLTNHNDELQWGKQLVDGKVKFVRKPKPKFERSQEDDGSGFKATHSLAEATYKLTGQIRDTEEKNRMRDLIISDPDFFSEEEKAKILEYNKDDVVFLKTMWHRIQQEFKKLDPDASLDEYIQEAKWRGRYAAHTAIMETRGYPINVSATKNFSNQVKNILMECQRDINEQFPEILPFKWNKRGSTFTWNQIATREWIKENHSNDFWLETDGGKKGVPQLSLSLEAFEKHYAFKHDYPRGNFGAQMVRFLKLKQSLYGFSDTGGKRKNFWDSVGSDGRVRPYMNIYGAQSSRSQPAASGFMFLKPAWMRALVEPAKDDFICGIDYGQQEFFLSGLESGDKNMIKAYLSGDPYLYGAKLAGAIPWDGTKETHKIERDLFKNTYLGILYGMTKYGLSAKLTNDTGREYTPEDAQEQIDLFEDTFPDYIFWKQELIEKYERGEGIILPDGWRMYTDNPNPRSVANVPIQGFGACVMRKAVDLAVARGCRILFTLHDAIYLEDKVGNEKIILELKQAMIDAFQYYFKHDKEKFDLAGNIKLDPFAWSPSYKKDSEIKLKDWKVYSSNLYIDDRSIKEYKSFSIYFENPEWESL